MNEDTPSVAFVSNTPIKEPAEWLVSADDDWTRFPGWALYMLDLGTALTGVFKATKRRMLVCVSVPFRTYATPLIVSGYFVGKIKGRTVEENETWFNELKTQDAPVLATYLKRGHTGLLVIRGYLDPPHSDEHLRLRYGPQLQELIDVRNLRFISTHPGPVFPLKKTRMPTPFQDDSVFWTETGIDPMSALAALGDNRLDVIAVGVRSQLLKDFSALSVRVRESASTTLTLARLCGLRTSASLPYTKTDIVSTRSEIPPLSTPTFTIFDGRASFLECQDYFPNCHHVIVADRVAVQHHNDTVDCVNRLFMDRRSSEDVISLLPRPPKGVNLSAFTLRSRNE
jgi:hypothetical protein